MAGLQNPALNSDRKAFENFLSQVKALMERKNLIPPSGFISYAWESGTDNTQLQEWLTQLKKDFGKLGINLFLDIQNMNGNMRECMQILSEREFVLLIGTPRLKARAMQDSLYLLPSFTPELLPKQGNVVVLTGLSH